MEKDMDANNLDGEELGGVGKDLKALLGKMDSDEEEDLDDDDLDDLDDDALDPDAEDILPFGFKRGGEPNPAASPPAADTPTPGHSFINQV
jgi:hypothetical protein